jgi:hypothetical protein
MRESIGDLWGFHDDGHYIVVPTNGSLNKKGYAVMGKGVALEAKKRFPTLPKELGECISIWGNVVYIFHAHRLITFPTKTDWQAGASLTLIERSARQLASLVLPDAVYMPRVGCGEGGLTWDAVKPILQGWLDDRVVIVSGEGDE